MMGRGKKKGKKGKKGKSKKVGYNYFLALFEGIVWGLSTFLGLVVLFTAVMTFDDLNKPCDKWSSCRTWCARTCTLMTIIAIAQPHPQWAVLLSMWLVRVHTHRRGWLHYSPIICSIVTYGFVVVTYCLAAEGLLEKDSVLRGLVAGVPATLVLLLISHNAARNPPVYCFMDQPQPDPVVADNGNSVEVIILPHSDEVKLTVFQLGQSMLRSLRSWAYDGEIEFLSKETLDNLAPEEKRTTVIRHYWTLLLGLVIIAPPGSNWTTDVKTIMGIIVNTPALIEHLSAYPTSMCELMFTQPTDVLSQAATTFRDLFNNHSDVAWEQTVAHGVVTHIRTTTSRVERFYFEGRFSNDDRFEDICRFLRWFKKIGDLSKEGHLYMFATSEHVNNNLPGKVKSIATELEGFMEAELALQFNKQDKT